MLKVRIYFSSEEEAQELIGSLEKDYKILSKSNAYKDRNSEYKRIYLEVEKENVEVSRFGKSYSHK